jgi:hypothetical protein
MTLMEIYEGLKAKYETSDSHGDLYEDYWDVTPCRHKITFLTNTDIKRLWVLLQ